MEGAAPSLSQTGAKRTSSRDLGQLRRLSAYLRPYRGHVLGALAALVLASAAVLSLGVGLRYQVPISHAHLLRFDVMHGWLENADDLSGARAEFRWKF